MGGERDGETPTELSGLSLDIPGTDWLFKRCPELFVLLGVVLLVGGGVAMILSNPAGNSTTGDAHGPDAPLQPWVVLMAVVMFVAGALLTVFLAVLVRQRVRRRRTEPRRGPPPEAGPLP